MNWNNNELVCFIRDQSTDLEYLKKQEPDVPVDNPLYSKDISLKELEFTLEMKEYLGDTDIDDDKSYISKSARAIIKGSSVDIIDLKDYSAEEIVDYHSYLLKRNEIREYNRNISSNYINEIPIFSFMYDRYNNKNILLLSNSLTNPLAVGLTEFDKLINSDISNQTRYFTELPQHVIEEELEDVEFNELRKRLIASGYTSIVEEIDDQLSQWLGY